MMPPPAGPSRRRLRPGLACRPILTLLPCAVHTRSSAVQSTAAALPGLAMVTRLSRLAL